MKRGVIEVKKTRALESYRTRKKIKRNKIISPKVNKKKIRSEAWNDKDFFTFLKLSLFNDKKRVRYKVLSDSTNVALVTIPEVFSLLKDPNAALKVLKILIEIKNDDQVKGIFIDHSNCEFMDLGASTLLDLFVLNIKDEFKLKTGKELKLKGYTSKNVDVSVMLESVGLLTQLGLVDSDTKEAIEEDETIKIAELLKGGKNTRTLKVDTSIKSSEVSDQICKFFEECLNTQGVQLTGEGDALFSDIIGEVVDNAIQHSGDFKQWFTAGHYTIVEDKDYGECHIVLINFGQTIYEGLKKMAQNKEKDTYANQLLNNLYKLTKEHKKIFNINWNEEVLWTLYALQEGVSRKLSENDTDRGTGTVTMIDAFQKIGGTRDGKTSEMCLLSGNAYIKFDDKYKISLNNQKDRQTIAFNETNDLSKMPDNDYVKKNNYFFPGTVITLKFFLDREFIINSGEVEKDNEH